MKHKKIICGLCALLFALAALTGPLAAIPPDSGVIYRGLDVSVYQGNIDFAAVKSSGYDVVYIRAGADGTYTDPTFEENYRAAEQAGLSIGFYYYMTATDTDAAVAQAQTFAGLIAGKNARVRPAMDYETYFGLGREAVNEVGLAFLTELERLTGVRPVVYSDSYRTRTLWDQRYADYPLWIADYNGGANPPDSPVWRSWAGFQFDDRGRINGIDGAVDLNRFTDGIFAEPDSAPTPAAPAEQVYTVRRGDTLSAIARRYGTTVSAIVAANGIQNPNLIYVGEVFRIPSGEPESGSILYTVRWGDTLSAIARRYGTTVSAIVAANGIRNPDLIYVGEVFRIP